MFNTQQIEEIDALLQKGVKPEEVANRYGLSLSSFRFKLYASGRAIKVTRRLVVPAPASVDSEKPSCEMMAAAE